MNIEENILNQVADANKILGAIQAYNNVSVDELKKLSNIIKKKGLQIDISKLAEKMNEPIKLNVKLDIK